MKAEILSKSAVVDATTAFETHDCESILLIVKKSGATTFKLQDSDDGTTFADVDAKYVIDETKEAAGVYKVAYLGYKKYVKAVLGTAANGEVIGVKYNLIHQP